MFKVKSAVLLFLQVFILSLMFGVSASAYEIKADFGLMKFTPVENGNCYQDGLSHTLRLNQPAASLSIYTDKSKDGYQLGLGFGTERKATTDAMVLNQDSNYNANSATHCNGPCGPLSHMQGEGKVPYTFLLLRKTWMNSFAFGKPIWLEGGPCYTRPSYSNTNWDWYGSNNYNAKPVVYDAGPIVSHIDHKVEGRTSATAAVGIELTKDISALVRLVPTSASNSQPDPLVPSGQTYYRGDYSKVSVYFGVQIKF